jgi:hypothetical protein
MPGRELSGFVSVRKIRVGFCGIRFKRKIAEKASRFVSNGTFQWFSYSFLGFISSPALITLMALL